MIIFSLIERLAGYGVREVVVGGVKKCVQKVYSIMGNGRIYSG
jgi:hypothetical protein